MALLLRLRAKARTDTLTNPPLLHHLFSTSNSGGGGDQPPSDSNSPLSSYVREVRNKLKQQSPSPSTPRSSSPSSFLASSSNSRQQQTSLDEIMSNLSEFRRRTSALPPYGDPLSPPPQQRPISFQDMYNKLQEPGSQSGGNAGGSEPAKPGGGSGPLPFDKIRGSLRQLKGAGRMSSPLGLNASRLKPSSGSAVIGGTSPLPELVFGRELKERKEVGGGPSATAKMDFVRSYGQPELGEKLRNLRPVVKGKEWFSIGELNERLMKLREMDDMEAKARPTGAFAMELRDAIATQIEGNKDDKSNKTSLQRIDMLGLLGGTPTYMLKPPKEHLVEKYFHPDNMSSAEKLKIELAKVRDEFKMSESDCGSARVQVAQLTTKIKHLSSVLHKKDVHSRKGLLAMVQRRKRLLKYLRETDWDSYCFVISKLGLRDNPDHGHKTRTGARSGAMAS